MKTIFPDRSFSTYFLLAWHKKPSERRRKFDLLTRWHACARATRPVPVDYREVMKRDPWPGELKDGMLRGEFWQKYRREKDLFMVGGSRKYVDDKIEGIHDVLVDLANIPYARERILAMFTRTEN